MTTRISIDNIDQAAVNSITSQAVTAAGGVSNTPKITSIAVANSSYTILDDTAVSTSGGYIVITGTGFASGCQVIINDVAANSTSFVNSTTVRAQIGARVAGTYNVYLTNPDGGTAIRINGVTYSGTPTWVTDSTLTAGEADTFISYTLNATGANIYSLQAGSSLPSGLTLSANGYLSGTITGINDTTTYSFIIEAIDTELQDSPRTFSVTISAGDAYINYVTTLINGDTPSTNTFLSDASTNNFTATPQLDTKPTRFSPFTPGYYSNYFDGTGDTLDFPNNSAFAFGTGSFTIEFWINAPLNNDKFILEGRNAIGTMHITTGGSASTAGVLRYVGSSTIVSSNVITDNNWHHCAIVRNGSSNITLYVDGVSVGTGTDTTNYTTTAGTFNGIGGRSAAGSNYLTGYISNFRIVKGTAVYTGAFTPSTTPLTAVANTSLLTCQSNRFKDESTNNFAITRNGDVKVTGFCPFPPNPDYDSLGSTFFDGTGDYVSIPDNVALRPGTSDFTIEFWAYHNSTSGYQVYVGKGQLSGGGSWLVEKGTNQGWGFQVNASSTIQTSTIAGSYYGFWFHIAVTRSGSTLRFFVDGTLMDTRTVSTELSNAAELQIGNATQVQWPFNGWMSNLRIVKGTALYTSNFTPSTTPLTAITNTSLLTLQNNRPINNNYFLDKSLINNVVARNGNPTQGSFSPYGDNWSNYFDGTGDYLSASNNASFDLTADFTVELWFNFSSLTTNPYTFLSNYASGASGWSFQFRGDASNVFRFGFGDTPQLNSSTQSISVGTWYHLAITRSGTTLRMFLNGIQIGTTTSSNSYTSSSALLVGSLTTGAQFFNGYLSNVRIVKGTALYTSNFTPSTTPIQPIANTSLLTCRDGSIVDDGPNLFSLTRNGDVRVSKFSPFLTSRLTTPYYSAFFDGVDDYLNIASGNIVNFGTSDFTAEAWVYLNTLDTSIDTIIGNYNNGSNGGFGFYINRGTNGGLQVYSGNSLVINANLAVTSGSWNHVAVCRSSGTTRIFVNGTSVANASDSNNYGTDNSATGIGGTPPGSGAGSYFPGYLSNVRVVKGTALYTTSFTPSTTPLTAISGTSLLVCQSSTFIDNSSNNFAITVTGSRPTLFSPFTSSYTTKEPYSTGTFGGSMYFDGTGDYLTINNILNNTLSVGANNFTVQAWVHPTAWTVEWNSIISTRPTASTGGFSNVFVLGVHNSGYPYIYSGDFQITGTAGQVKLGNWTHLCVSRANNTMRLFVNGALANTTTTLQNYTTATGAVGANFNGSEQWTGYLSDVSLTAGEAIYTSAFVPPLAPLSAANNTLLLLGGTDSVIPDFSMKNDIETLGNVRLNSSVKKYGNSSIYFDGTGDNLVLATNNVIAFGTAAFTIEAWVNRTSSGSVTHFIDFRGPNNDNSNPVFYWQTNNFLYYTNSNSTGDNQIQTSNAVTSSSGWVHIAIVRSGTTLTVYINGVASGSVTYSTNVLGGNPITIGNRFNNSGAFAGYINDLRITPGVARYTANFTPPAKLPLK